MYLASLSKDFSSITALMKLLKSSVGPILNDSTSEMINFFNSGQSDSGMYTREAAEHFCPWYSNAPRTMAVADAFTSAEGCTKMKSFPPVSPTMRGYER